MDMNVTFPIANFQPSNPPLSHTSQCIMRRFVIFTTRILLGCSHQGWRLVLDLWHVWEKRYIHLRLWHGMPKKQKHSEDKSTKKEINKSSDMSA